MRPGDQTILAKHQIPCISPRQCPASHAPRQALLPHRHEAIACCISPHSEVLSFAGKLIVLWLHFQILFSFFLLISFLFFGKKE